MPSTPAHPGKTRVIGIVGLMIIGGLQEVIQDVNQLLAANKINASGLQGYDWVAPLAYVGLILGALELISAVLIFFYKRIGLYIGGTIFLIGLIVTATQFLGASLDWGAIISVVIDLTVLYYVYIYLTRDPERSFFN
jgi:hypothetical protein